MALIKLNNQSLSAVTSAGLPSGTVLQVQSTTKTDTFTANLGTTFVAITGLSVSITPSSTSSKILIMSNLFVGSNADNFFHFRLYRNGSNLSGATGDADGVRARDYSYNYLTATSGETYIALTQSLPNYLDLPATTSSLTYQIYVGDPNSGGNPIYINRIKRDDNAVYEPRGISTITAMEIAG